MKILAIETSGTSGGISLLNDQEAQYSKRLDREQRSAKYLSPTIRDGLDSLGWSANDIDLVAVTTGPGSFTGLRVGVTTAKTFAYAVQAKIVGVSTLLTLAAQYFWSEHEESSQLHAIVDAHRKELFAARFLAPAKPGELPQIASQPAIIPIATWLDELSTESPQDASAVTGTPLTSLHEQIGKTAKIADERLWTPCAGTVGKIAWLIFQSQGPDDLWGLKPDYQRQSAAEEKRSQSI